MTAFVFSYEVHMSDSKTFPYTNVIKNLPFIAFVRTKTATGKYSYEFPAAKDREFFGFSALDDVLTDMDGCLDIVHWKDKDKLAQAIGSSERELKPSSENFCVVLPSGQKRWLSGAAVPQKKKNGDIVWRGLWMDVTAEKQKDGLNALILENMREGVAVFDRQGHIFALSPSLTEMLSLSPEDTEKNFF